MLKLGAELLCALKDFACDQISPPDSLAYLKGRVCRNTSTQPPADALGVVVQGAEVGSCVGGGVTGDGASAVHTREKFAPGTVECAV